MKRQPLNIARGQAGVHSVLSELIKRGHAPYLPVIDTGIDILLGSLVRLQVKTTQRPTSHWRLAGSWSFTLTSSQKIVKKRYVKGAPRKFSDEVDFVVLHAADANRFWIVPAFVLDGRNTVQFKDGVSQWKSFDVDAARRMRSDGASYQTIADALGATHHTVMRRLNGLFAEPKRKYTEMSQYEDRWDLIAGAAATLREANAVVTDTKTMLIDSPVR